MHILALLWGIIAIIIMTIGFFPCLGSLNWLNIPFAGIGIIVSSLALAASNEYTRASSVAGLVCCSIALFFGIFRLIIGGGIF